MMPSHINRHANAGPFEQFASTLLPAGLNEQAIAELREVTRHMCVARGTPAAISGATDQFVFVIRGTVKLVAHVGDREQILSFHFSGDLAWLPAHSSHDLVFCATSDCELLVVPAAALMASGKRDSTVLQMLLERCTASLDRSRDKVILLGRKSAPERMADFLLSLAKRLGLSAAATQTLNLTMSRRDIADALGLTIETVSRQLGELRLAGVIETRGRSSIRLLDRGELAKRSGRPYPVE